MVAPSSGPSARPTPPRVLIVVQNLHVPFDRRVWLECLTLRAAGYGVTVICPRGPESKPHEVLEGVEVWTYPSYAPGDSSLNFVLEYAYSFLATAWLVARTRRHGRLSVLQACNPPDIFWPLALILRRLDGTRFVFDHHDLCPELFESRFPDGRRLPHFGLLMLERATFRTADRVVSTNRSYAEVARRRGRKKADDVTVVRTGPDAEKLRRGPARPDLRRGRRHLVAYLGVMGPQDGVDLALEAAGILINDMGRDDITFIFMGGGDSHAALLEQRRRLNLEDFVELPGRVPDAFVHEVLSTADVGLCPDPKSPLNDVSTMNKTMEFMAYELPIVAFDLRETRVSAAEAAVYVGGNDVAAYARAIASLLDDPQRRAEMGRVGRRRVEDELAWRHQSKAYLDVYAELLQQSTDRQEV